MGESAEMPLKEQLANARETIKSLRKRIEQTEDDSMRYRRMRQLEVVIMAEDGAKYLKGEDLDRYIDDLPARVTMNRAELLKELLPGLNSLFGAEYQKYQDEHGDEIAAHIDAEVMRNVKT